MAPCAQGETWGNTSKFLPSLWGANCHGAALENNGSFFYAMPAYTGPARMPNPVQKTCTYKGHCHVSSSSLAGLPKKAKAPDAQTFAQTDRAPNRINGTIFKATSAALSDWAVHERVTIGEADGGHQTYAAFGYSSLSPLPTGLWPNAIGLMYETGAPDCGYDPHQSTATGMGSSTSACKIVFAVVDV